MTIHLNGYATLANSLVSDRASPSISRRQRVPTQSIKTHDHLCLRIRLTLRFTAHRNGVVGDSSSSPTGVGTPFPSASPCHEFQLDLCTDLTILFLPQQSSSHGDNENFSRSIRHEQHMVTRHMASLIKLR
ncbi:unnamed protein product [Cochlearia groenlandica]